MDAADRDYDRRTVHVQGVSFSMQQDQFEEAFSEIGPVRKCFLIRKNGREKHQGSGFVQFALPDDAARAIQEFDGKLLLGRQVQVTRATKRAPLAFRKQRQREAVEGLRESETAQEAAKRTKRARIAAVVDVHALPRTIALGNFTPETLDKVLEKAYSAGEVESVLRNVEDSDLATAKIREDGCTGAVIFVQYKTVKLAVDAVAKLHGATICSEYPDSGELRNCACKLWARQVKGEGAMVKKWKIILRNLSFNVKEEELREALTPAGFVWDLAIARKADGGSKGFAFASFTSRAHAERAIKLLNGKTIKKRMTAVDWAVPKSIFLSGQTLAGSVEEQPSAERESPTDMQTQQEFSEQDGLSEKELMRNVARQFVCDSDLEEEPDEQPPQNLSPQTRERRRTVPAAAVAGPSSFPPEHRTSATASLTGRTLFVRGLGSNATKQQLQARLESFGPIKACRLVINPTTNQPKGTAFVEFEHSAAAETAALASARGRSGEGPGVSMGGVLLQLDVALSQEDARATAAQRAGKAGAKIDKRNLYLAKEGTIEEGSPAWEGMSKGDQEKRARASVEKATKLRNPNFFVSTTRLSLRNLPLSLEEKGLKSLLLAAVKERASQAVPELKQVKVLREPDKLNKDGKPQSKGIAFAEFTKHEHALCAVRQLNNNPGPFGKDRRPVIEFAIENALTLKKKEEREAARKELVHESNRKRKAQKSAADSRGANSQDAPLSHAKKPRKDSTGKKQGPEAPGGIAKEGKLSNPRRRLQQASEEYNGLSKPTTFKQQTSTLPTGDGKNAHGRNAVRRKPVAAQTGDDVHKQKGKMAKHGEKEETDAFDGLVTKYKTMLFGEKKTPKQENKGSSLKRWFE